ncbi:hypothetical protein OV208_21460 [Corallococcus sp. bb12-1]|uniref:hypothetical protein n=1 Tax=Corallococcus sp. bb12-1 TaxID=2996784 RepID=UPI00226D48B5|nr:hypothetical protein [Corallococcus sp. bb12-1]MCY1043899.1 hypothetical protein [Corallococcus sp. bb12-1]
MRPGWRESDVTDMPMIGTHIDTFDGMERVPGGPGARLRWARTRATDFRAAFVSTGTPDSVDTCELVTLPYPTKFGLFRASTAVAPFLSITNRMLVIRWRETDGRQRVLLFEPSDVELGRKTPYFAARGGRAPGSRRSSSTPTASRTRRSSTTRWSSKRRWSTGPRRMSASSSSFPPAS